MRLREIGDTLAARADGFPEYAHAHAELAVFHFDNLTVRCRPTRDAVIALAKRYQKPKSYGTPNPVGKARYPRGYRKSVLAAFIEDGERETAIEYARLFPESKLCVDALILVRAADERDGLWGAAA